MTAIYFYVEHLQCDEDGCKGTIIFAESIKEKNK